MLKKIVRIRETCRSQSYCFLIIILAALLLCSCSAPGIRADTNELHLHEDENISLKATFEPATLWSNQKLEVARRYAKKIGSVAVIVIHDGKLVAEWGETTKRIKSHSVRKSLLSALYGIAVNRGLINMSDTMEELGIDDKPPSLTMEEKQARISDLIKARSGIYHLAAAEHPSMKKRRPRRGSHPRDTFWYYNNWDFNVLGTIFEQKTDLSIGEAFKRWIADPVGMQDFRAQDVTYERTRASIHLASPFWVSARDLSRFGVLFLQQGKWGNKQVVPKAWIRESTIAHTPFRSGGGYGYMWWILKSGAYEASGTGLQKIHIDPHRRVVIVNRVNTGSNKLKFAFWWVFGKKVSNIEFNYLINLIYEALPALQKTS